MIPGTCDTHVLHAFADVALILRDGLCVVLLLNAQLPHGGVEACKLLLALPSIDTLITDVLVCVWGGGARPWAGLEKMEKKSMRL